ncbi:Serine protease, subtilase family [hydrothermal vent metagenome]|uniref:Serine protease, subtilase family n=1 Tax=hydrothermal vent metagenome TaxID=652676 RepID=A0A3B1A037_9ZZZZ
MLDFKIIIPISIISLSLLKSVYAVELTPLEKFQRYELAATTSVTHIVVKFKEGTGIRLRNGSLRRVARLNSTLPTNITIPIIANDVAVLLQIANSSGYSFERLFSLTEKKLEDLKISGEATSQTKLNSLNLYYRISMELGNTFINVEDILKSINVLPSIEIAYAVPVPSLAVSSTPVSPDFTARQGYLNAPSQNGINAKSAWQVVGGRGKGVSIFDVEGAWQLTHEDFPTNITDLRSHLNDIDWLNHGTAVLGIMATKENAAGITGITSNATFGVSSFNGVGIADAISTAATNAGTGGVVLLELQTGGAPITANCDAACNPSQCDLVPVEYQQANFDVIQTATANGVIVVEAAGNGTVDLDHPDFNGVFDRNIRDSGAIIVGASFSSSSQPMCFTNFGSRVDVHAWGENVMTTGYGALFNSGADHLYTGGFAGTSSASPIVVGSVASIQGVRLANGLPVLNSIQMRNLLVSRGTPQTINTAVRIGPLPNIKASIDSFLLGMTQPVDGLPLVGSSVDFSWNIPSGASNMWLYIGSSLGAADIYNAEQGLTSTTATVTNIPVDGRKIYARLYDLQSGVWQSTDYVYLASGISSPVDGVTLSNASTRFKWRVPQGSIDSYLYIGTTVGANDIYNAQQPIDSTGVTVNNLPVDGSLLYVRFYYYQGAWLFTDYVYTASN